MVRTTALVPAIEVDMVQEARSIAILVGNGLSIAFNHELALQSLTSEVLSRIENAEGGDVVSAMKEIAERALPRGVSSDSDFEMLVGAFGAESRTLGLLGTLAKLQSPSDRKLRRSIKRVSVFANQVRDNGISYVLQVIAERSHAYEDESVQLRNLVKDIIRDFDGKVTFGNLNYDTLLLAALLSVCQDELADMGHGWRSVSVTVEDHRTISVPALRADVTDFPTNRRVQLLHMHGSLTFWATADGTIFAKLPRESLEDADQWEAVRARTTNVRPVVVLANQKDKAEHVERYPFNLAYEAFSAGLSRAAHWLIIGYSFRDAPVNTQLKVKFRLAIDPPIVLVVLFGDSPTRVEIEQAFGWSRDDGASEEWLLIDREGADGVQDRAVWTTFVS
ncbi:hypothetical protein QFZ62_000021 [Clavibacter sp. B3I6]|uniref:SIR2 family protein n=1 Tax=Clavibacter sp. B3I6 TaxID=3042268 RepID=UPI00278A1F75|nr:SIR2 family protein [Clavibacter sp. B3I6]MDQ0742713.1 hypothetical protein [Clavibacter sp. B3I6]